MMFVPLALGVLTLAASPASARPAADSLEATSSQNGKGTLVICGGGRLPEEIVARFLEAAGGEKAHLVVVPTASERADWTDRSSLLAPWKGRGVASVAVLHTRSKAEANREEFVAPLRRATAVWFTGGNQSRLAEAYLGTRFEQEVYRLLERGGAVGGTSAGAAIMSRLMIAGGRGTARIGVGFDLLPDAVIDQHFRQRNRKPRLQGVVERHPDRFGVGIDEGTALVVQSRRLQVVGESRVTVCLPPRADRRAAEFTLPAGAAADLDSLRSAAFRASSPTVGRAEGVDRGRPRFAAIAADSSESEEANKAPTVR